jgi:hypothetical protein
VHKSFWRVLRHKNATHCFIHLQEAAKIAIYSTVCSLQVMLKNLEQVVSMILNGFQHPHARVRWAAINAIGQLSTDLGPDLQVNYHQQVLPALANAMDDFQNPRVQVSVQILVLDLI